MNPIAELAYQFIPVALGMAALLILKGLKFDTQKITILTDSANDLSSGKDAQKAEITRDAAFEQAATDLLIVNGIMPKRKQARRLALEKLGMIDVSNAYMANKLLSVHKCDRIIAYAWSKDEMLKCLLSRNSQFLLAYAIAYKLDVFNA
ncbi:MAG: hypothetical protein ACP5MC_01305 [Candidatus Micrarchaeia archaeon]